MFGTIWRCRYSCLCSGTGRPLVVFFLSVSLLCSPSLAFPVGTHEMLSSLEGAECRASALGEALGLVSLGDPVSLPARTWHDVKLFYPNWTTIWSVCASLEIRTGSTSELYWKKVLNGTFF